MFSKEGDISVQLISTQALGGTPPPVSQSKEEHRAQFNPWAKECLHYSILVIPLTKRSQIMKTDSSEKKPRVSFKDASEPLKRLCLKRSWDCQDPEKWHAFLMGMHARKDWNEGLSLNELDKKTRFYFYNAHLIVSGDIFQEKIQIKIRSK